MVLLDFQEIALVGDFEDHLAHVVGLVGAVGNDGVEARLGAVDDIIGADARGLVVGVQWQEIEQAPDFEQRLDVVVEGSVGDG